MIRLFFNWLTIGGFALILVTLGTGIFFFFLEAGSGVSSGYLGVIYLALVLLVFLGMLAVPLGMWRERRLQARGETSIILSDWVIDFRTPRHRRLFFYFLIASIGIALFCGVATYKTYHLTESKQFCGQLCHTVMAPEWVTYGSSPHARVDCVQCHIGSGAKWYVRSKLSGLRQVFAVFFNTFPRPIPTPIEHLRPARETCEECHWPGKFAGHKEVVRSYYLSDPGNSRWRIRMLMKVAGNRDDTYIAPGIHYHMLLEGRVEYVARDGKRQDIPLVRLVHPDGRVDEYASVAAPLTEEERGRLAPRIMDCLDCHNRPAHKFIPPVDAVNRSLAAGRIPATLPHIKREAVLALSREYGGADEALAEVSSAVRGFYQKNFPGHPDASPALIDQAIVEIQDILGRTIFPEMGADWKSYPDNLGHRDAPGCFRCHNEDLVSGSGKNIAAGCTDCHIILAQGEDIDRITVDLSQGLSFVHPADQEAMEGFVVCSECHTGGGEIYE